MLLFVGFMTSITMALPPRFSFTFENSHLGFLMVFPGAMSCHMPLPISGPISLLQTLSSGCVLILSSIQLMFLGQCPLPSLLLLHPILGLAAQFVATGIFGPAHLPTVAFTTNVLTVKEIIQPSDVPPVLLLPIPLLLWLHLVDVLLLQMLLLLLLLLL